MFQRKCKICEKSYKSYPKRNETYCSRKCRAVDQSADFRGENNHMFGRYGNLNPMFGRQHSSETLQKISATSKGRWLGKHHTEETKMKISEASKELVRLGIHHLWKGGKTSETMMIRTSKRYRDWRTAVFNRDNYTCQICLTRGGSLEADHIKSFAHYPNVRFDITNGRTLCKFCHRQTANFGRRALLVRPKGIYKYES